MMRSGRHAAILEIISKKEIETQEELCDELNKRNYSVTQATVSRDIKELRLFKVAGTEKKYKYAYIDEGINKISPKMHNLFRECVLSIRSALNQVVIKTLRGNGSPKAPDDPAQPSYNNITGAPSGGRVSPPSDENAQEKTEDGDKS